MVTEAMRTERQETVRRRKTGQFRSQKSANKLRGEKVHNQATTKSYPTADRGGTSATQR